MILNRAGSLAQPEGFQDGDGSQAGWILTWTSHPALVSLRIRLEKALLM
jgi:hypothetical protein